MPEKSQKPTVPGLDALTARFLNQQAQARAAGIPEPQVDEVEPYEAAFAPLVEPRTAWEESLSALKFLDPEKAKISFSPPADWSSLVSGTESISALACAAGNYPQLLRDLPALIRGPRRAIPTGDGGLAVSAPSLASWAREHAKKGKFPQALFRVGVLRLARQFDAAAELLNDLHTQLPARWHAALANEEAALAWHRGQAERALQLWNEMSDSAPVCFNRGMAALFLNRLADARAALTQAVALLPEDNSWHHLARLYLALAEV